MNYKVGDKVKIREDLSKVRFIEERYREYIGQEAMITAICCKEHAYDSFPEEFYEINIDYGKNEWTDEMIEGLAEEEKSAKNGCKSAKESEENMEELISMVELAQMEVKPNSILIDDYKYNYNKDEDCYYEGDSGYEKLTMHIPFKDYVKKQIRIAKELLNKEEKEFLELMIKYNYCKAEGIQKVSEDNTIYLAIWTDDGVNTTQRFKAQLFKNLETNKKYPISELLGDE